MIPSSQQIALLHVSSCKIYIFLNYLWLVVLMAICYLQYQSRMPLNICCKKQWQQRSLPFSPVFGFPRGSWWETSCWPRHACGPSSKASLMGSHRSFISHVMLLLGCWEDKMKNVQALPELFGRKKAILWDYMRDKYSFTLRSRIVQEPPSSI